MVVRMWSSTALRAPAGDERFGMRAGVLRSDALVAAGQRDSARAVLTALTQQYPDSRFLADALKKLQ